MPVVELTLNGGCSGLSLVGEKATRSLANSLLDAVIHLSNRGVKRIHLFLAGVAFRFGRLYDKRNLPEAERSTSIREAQSRLIRGVFVNVPYVA